ncbi:unnamed protein product [Closterium sp. Naga37s-1]|nr:unnamed protein product [Closterium sp. Naga37s-1]
MSPPAGARLAYVILYVEDIDAAVKFYKDVFMFDVRRVDNSRRWAELESGSTTLAFTPLEQRETKITGGVHAPEEEEQRQNAECEAASRAAPIPDPSFDSFMLTNPATSSPSSFTPLSLHKITHMVEHPSLHHPPCPSLPASLLVSGMRSGQQSSANP